MVGRTWLQEHEEDDLTVLISKKQTGIKADVLRLACFPLLSQVDLLSSITSL